MIDMVVTKISIHENIYACTLIICTELEISVEHWAFSMHFAQISEHTIVCADIMSRHSLEQKLSTVVD